MESPLNVVQNIPSISPSVTNLQPSISKAAGFSRFLSGILDVLDNLADKPGRERVGPLRDALRREIEQGHDPSDSVAAQVDAIRQVVNEFKGGFGPGQQGADSQAGLADKVLWVLEQFGKQAEAGGENPLLPSAETNPLTLPDAVPSGLAINIQPSVQPRAATPAITLPVAAVEAAARVESAALPVLGGVTEAGPEVGRGAVGTREAGGSETAARVDFVEQVVRAARLARARGGGRITISLELGALGPMKIDLAMKQAVLHGILTVETPATQEVIVSQLQSLRDALVARDIEVGQLEVQVEQSADPSPRDAGRESVPRRPGLGCGTLPG